MKTKERDSDFPFITNQKRRQTNKGREQRELPRPTTYYVPRDAGNELASRVGAFCGDESGATGGKGERGDGGEAGQGIKDEGSRSRIVGKVPRGL